ncbi:hypothetical protein CALCODRAFT_481712 [Calocera cornea HHB12733]|uniref:Uncharacterized protein n=1 Tax=Calocera cornea HHB12733 TaxID=1353952 RepID=A0A165HHQ4_9BASI|nr:hypothetical protein CALCODRAFT_481712 [Calocera cornea HHB12733]
MQPSTQVDLPMDGNGASGVEQSGASGDLLDAEVVRTVEAASGRRPDPLQSASPPQSSFPDLSTQSSPEPPSDRVTTEVDGGLVTVALNDHETLEREEPAEPSVVTDGALHSLIEQALGSQGSLPDDGGEVVANGGWGGSAPPVAPWSGEENDVTQSPLGSQSTANPSMPATELVILEAVDAAPADHPGRCSILVLMTSFGVGAPEKYLIRHARLEEGVYRIDEDVMRTRVDVLMDIVMANVTPRRGWATYEVCHELWLSRVPAAIHAVDNRVHGGWWLASARDAINRELVTARGISSVLVGSAITRRFVLDHLRLLRMDEYLFVLCFELLKFRRWHAVKAVLHHLHVIDDAAHADGTITINGVPVIANQVLDWMGYPYNTFKNKRTLVKLFDDIVTETEDIGCETDPDLPEILKYFVDPARPWPLSKGSGTTVGERTAATINEKDLHARAKKIVPFLSSRGRNIKNRRA